MASTASPLSDPVARARAFAIEAHGTQRYGDRPYAAHLDAVADLLGPFSVDAKVVGYLHDVVEDTPVPVDRVRESFGELIASCVELVTDQPGTNRRERKAATNAKLANVSGELQLALCGHLRFDGFNFRMIAPLSTVFR